VSWSITRLKGQLHLLGNYHVQGYKLKGVSHICDIRGPKTVLIECFMLLLGYSDDEIITIQPNEQFYHSMICICWKNNPSLHLCCLVIWNVCTLLTTLLILVWLFSCYQIVPLRLNHIFRSDSASVCLYIYSWLKSVSSNIIALGLLACNSPFFFKSMECYWFLLRDKTRLQLPPILNV